MESWREELYHHGINGQKWGVRNGPPYPLTLSAHSSKERRNNPKSALSKYDSEARKEKRRVKGLYEKAKYAASATHVTKNTANLYKKSADSIRLHGGSEKSENKFRRMQKAEERNAKLAQKKQDELVKEAFDAAVKFSKKYGNDKASSFKFSEDENGHITVYFKNGYQANYALNKNMIRNTALVGWIGAGITGSVNARQYERYINDLNERS